MRSPFLALSFAAAFAVAPLTTLADANTLTALQEADIEMSAELSAKVGAAEGDTLAAAIADVVTALGNDGDAIRAAVAAAVQANPDLAMEITSAVCLANPGVCAVVAGAAAGAAPSMAPDIAAAAAQAVPAQSDLIVNTVIASVNNESMNAAIRRAVGGAFGDDQLEEGASGVAPSPN